MWKFAAGRVHSHYSDTTLVHQHPQEKASWITAGYLSSVTAPYLQKRLARTFLPLSRFSDTIVGWPIWCGLRGCWSRKRKQVLLAGVRRLHFLNKSGYVKICLFYLNLTSTTIYSKGLNVAKSMATRKVDPTEESVSPGGILVIIDENPTNDEQETKTLRYARQWSRQFSLVHILKTHWQYPTIQNLFWRFYIKTFLCVARRPPEIQQPMSRPILVFSLSHPRYWGRKPIFWEHWTPVTSEGQLLGAYMRLFCWWLSPKTNFHQTPTSLCSTGWHLVQNSIQTSISGTPRSTYWCLAASQDGYTQRDIDLSAARVLVFHVILLSTAGYHRHRSILFSTNRPLQLNGEILLLTRSLCVRDVCWASSQWMMNLSEFIVFFKKN